MSSRAPLPSLLLFEGLILDVSLRSFCSLDVLPQDGCREAPEENQKLGSLLGSHRPRRLQGTQPPLTLSPLSPLLLLLLLGTHLRVLQSEENRSTMDYISSFDIRLSKDVYYAGETVSGSVILENTENIKIKGESRANWTSAGIRVLLRGKVHATLKVVKSGERRTVKDDQYVLDEKTVIWGKGLSPSPL